MNDNAIAGMSYVLWDPPRTGPEWVHTPTIEIRRHDPDGEVAWSFTLRELPEPRHGSREGGGLPPATQFGPVLRLDAFSGEGFAAFADPGFAPWFFPALVTRQPQQVREVAGLLFEHGVADDTARERLSQGLTYPQQ